MPQPPTTNMSLILPTPGGDAGSWGDLLNAVEALIDGHDHSTGKGPQVTPSGLNINADLTFATHSATHLKSADFDEVAALSTGARRLFWNSSDHELYIRTAGGVNVKLTNGSAINVAAFVGGIGGDYAAAGALVSYDDSTRRYLLQQEGSPRPWAGLATADIDLYEKAASIVNKVTLKSPGALAASYALTLPAALPAAGLPLQCSAAGVLSLSATFPTTALFVAGSFKNNVVDPIVAPASMADGGGNTVIRGAQGVKAWQFTNQPTAVTFPMPFLHPGDTIDSYSVQFTKNSTGATTVNSRLYTADATGAETAQGVGAGNNSNGGGAGVLTEAGPLGVVVPANGQAYIAVWAVGGGTTDTVINAVFSVRRA